MRPYLFLCIFLKSDALAQTILNDLDSDRYMMTIPASKEDFFKVIEHERQQIDCLILQDDSELPFLANWLHGQATLLPAILVKAEAGDKLDGDVPASTWAQATDLREEGVQPLSSQTFAYHTAEVRITSEQLEHIALQIDRAITQFLNLSPACRLSASPSEVEVAADLTTQNFLMLQQRRLAEKLKERLGYLGVYYKRNPQNFLRYLPSTKQQEFLEKLKAEYREIVLRYFADDSTVNQRIDDFVNTAFFADISVSQVVETHMELMDEFAKQLKLEGRSEEVLLDYRLTLIDAIAHLCEMYRRSIPRES